MLFENILFFILKNRKWKTVLKLFGFFVFFLFYFLEMKGRFQSFKIILNSMKSGGEDTCLDKSKNRKKLIQKINKKTKAVDLLDWSEHAL